MRQKGFVPIILLVIVLAVIGGAVFFFRSQKPQQTATNSKTENQQNQATRDPNLVWSYLKETSFDGKSGKVEFSKNDIAKIADLKSGTISVWFKFNKTGDKLFLPILYLGKKEGSDISSNLVIEIGHYTPQDPSNQRLYYTFFNTGELPFLCFDSGEDLKPDTWYHFVAVNSEKGNTGYLNGKEITKRRYNFSNSQDTRFIADIPTKEVFYLGYGWFGIDQKWQYFSGSIKDVKIYDKAMTAGEVAKID